MKFETQGWAIGLTPKDNIHPNWRIAHVEGKGAMTREEFCERFLCKAHEDGNIHFRLDKYAQFPITPKLYKTADGATKYQYSNDSTIKRWFSQALFQFTVKVDADIQIEMI
jgi:hypothetical protein